MNKKIHRTLIHLNLVLWMSLIYHLNKSTKGKYWVITINKKHLNLRTQLKSIICYLILESLKMQIQTLLNTMSVLYAHKIVLNQLVVCTIVIIIKTINLNCYLLSNLQCQTQIKLPLSFLFVLSGDDNSTQSTC